MPRGYITGLQKRTPLTRTGRERELMEHILTHNANSSKQYEDAQKLTELALKKFQESTKLIKRVKKAESDSLKYQREREADERIHNDRLKKENLEDSEFSGRLQKLGRKEGRVLNILQMKLAITPWCNLNINLNKLNDLNEEDIDTVTESISRSLKALIKNK